MFSPVDTRQTQALVDHRRAQVAADAERTRQSDTPRSAELRRVGRLRTAVGIRLIRIGARIAGVYAHNDPLLRPGV